MGQRTHPDEGGGSGDGYILIIFRVVGVIELFNSYASSSLSNDIYVLPSGLQSELRAAAGPQGKF